MTKGWEFLHKWCALDDDHLVEYNVRHNNLCVSMVAGNHAVRFFLSEVELREANSDLVLHQAQKAAKELLEMQRSAA